LLDFLVVLLSQPCCHFLALFLPLSEWTSSIRVPFRKDWPSRHSRFAHFLFGFQIL
jgi:hypothetical protein